jgi:hypothetical protein
MVLDYAREVPSHADHYGGPSPTTAHVEVGGQPGRPAAGIGAGDRVLTTLPIASPAGAAVLLGVLAAGASLILLAAGNAETVAPAERATATAGITAAGLTRLA